MPDTPDTLIPHERACAAALALTEGIGWVLLGRLLERFGSPATILSAGVGELQAVRGIGQALAARIHATDPAEVAARLGRYIASGLSVILWHDADYPAAFDPLRDKPLILFYRGLPMASRGQPQPRVAIVGTRSPSQESIVLAEAWAGELAARGWCVVSGMARGIDSAAHRGALWGAGPGAGPGATLAVLGGGLNRIYPPENAKLAAQIEARGGLLSEVWPDSQPSREALVLRNRLIAGLSRALIVIEAPQESGALHAARRAHAQGKPVFAVDNSAGNAELLRDFAHVLPDEAPEAVETLIGQIERLALQSQMPPRPDTPPDDVPPAADQLPLC